MPAIAPVRQSRLSELKVGNLELDFEERIFGCVHRVSSEVKLLLFFCMATEPPESKMAVHSFQVSHPAPMLKRFLTCALMGPIEPQCHSSSCLCSSQDLFGQSETSSLKDQLIYYRMICYPSVPVGTVLLAVLMCLFFYCSLKEKKIFASILLFYCCNTLSCHLEILV